MLAAQRRTVTLIVVLSVRPPDLPVMVTWKDPVVARAPADRVSVPVLVAGLGLKTAVVPLRRPEAVSATLPAKRAQSTRPARAT